MGAWSQVWKAAEAAMGQLSIGWQLAVILVAGLLVLAMLEGLHLLLLPRRVLKRLARRYPR
jgi:hypothetical protein